MVKVAPRRVTFECFASINFCNLARFQGVHKVTEISNRVSILLSSHNHTFRGKLVEHEDSEGVEERDQGLEC